MQLTKKKRSAERDRPARGEPRAPLPEALETIIIERVTPELDGGRHPIKRFEASMEAANINEQQKQRFYCDNFVDLMGAGLA